MSRHTFAVGRNSWADRGFDEAGGRGVYWEGDWEYSTLLDVDALSAAEEAKREEAKKKESDK